MSVVNIITEMRRALQTGIKEERDRATEALEAFNNTKNYVDGGLQVESNRNYPKGKYFYLSRPLLGELLQLVAEHHMAKALQLETEFAEFLQLIDPAESYLEKIKEPE